MTAEPLTPEQEARIRELAQHEPGRPGEWGDRTVLRIFATLDAARKASRGSGLDVDAVLPPLPADAYVSEQFRAGWLAARAALDAARKASPPLDVEGISAAVSGASAARRDALNAVYEAMDALSGSSGREGPSGSPRLVPGVGRRHRGRAAGPDPMSTETCPYCDGAGCLPCRGRGTVGPSFRANRADPMSTETRRDGR